MTDSRELEIALGPVGALGLLAVVVGLVRRSPLLVVSGGVAVWADVRYPALGGFGAVRADTFPAVVSER